MAQQQSKLGLHEALGSLWEAHVRWRISKSWYCSLLLPESRTSNFNSNISVHGPPGPLPTMPAGRPPAGKRSTAPVATNPQRRRSCWCKHEPQQQQAAPKAEMVLQQGVSGCCQEDRAWCQLGRWGGLQLPRGVKQYPLPEGREQRRERMNNCAAKQVTFGSLCNLLSYGSISTPEGSRANL